MKRTFEKLEDEVLNFLFDGNDPVLKALRDQRSAIVSMREQLTGSGFYLEFQLAEDAISIPGKPSFRFGDVDAKIEGVDNGAGFVVFIENGIITMLEGYTYDEPWPDNISNYELSYDSGNIRDLSALQNTPGWPIFA
jgi:hypothetical protein